MRFFIYFCAILSAGVAHAGTCASRIGQCAYYECKEQAAGCGQDGYFISFGLKYCQRYLHAEPHFTPRGRAWLDQVRTCLQVKLETPAESYTCDTLEAYAVNTHYDCYMHAGYCSLPLTDKWLVSLVGAELILKTQIVNLIDRLEAACFDRATRI